MVTCQPNRVTRARRIPRREERADRVRGGVRRAVTGAGLQRRLRRRRFKAVDFEWLANGGTGNELTIAAGRDGDVRLSRRRELPQRRSSSGRSRARAPASNPPTREPGVGGELPLRRPPGPTASSAASTPAMTGRVIVAAPTPTPTPTPTRHAGAPPTATPTPTATPRRRPQTALKVTLARNQRSMRVRGAVEVEQAGSRAGGDGAHDAPRRALPAPLGRRGHGRVLGRARRQGPQDAAQPRAACGSPCGSR